MRTDSNRIISTPVAAMLVIGLASFASASWAHDQKVCVTTAVPEAFTLPDGSVHAAGKLTLCTHSLLNPVTGLHRVSAEGDGAILVMSRRSVAREYSDDRPALLFVRAPGTPLDLVGYVVPFDSKTWKYTLKSPNGIRSAQSAAIHAPPPAGELVMLLASNGY
jgi:hypothetical protein